MKTTIEFKGIVEKIHEEWKPKESFRPNVFRSKKITIFAPQYGGAKTGYYTVEFKEEGVNLLKNINEGDIVTVTASVGGIKYSNGDGNEWKYMNVLIGENVSKHKL